MHHRNVEIRLAHTLAALGERRVGDLKPHDLVRLRSEATQAGKSNRTANLIVETIRAMLNWAVETGLISESPLKRIKKLPEGKDHQRYKRRALSAEELGRFLAASAEDDKSATLMAESKGHPRVPQTPLWILCLETGGRWNELRLLSWADVDLGASILILRAENTKSRKARAIPLTPRAQEALRMVRLQQQRVLGRLPTAHDRVLLSPDGVPWPKPTTNPMRILDRVLDRAGIAKWDPRGEKLDIRALRHTFATRMARAGVPLSHAQAALGHSDPKLTAQVYTHLQAEDLRGSLAAMAELPWVGEAMPGAQAPHAADQRAG
jgi:integrase